MISYILCGIIIFQHITHHFERKDLYNRIMSKNFTEYKGERRHAPSSAHARLIKQWRGKGGENE